METLRVQEADRVAAQAAAAAAAMARQEAENARVATAAIDAAIAARDDLALDEAISIAMDMSLPASDEIDKYMAMAARVLAYLQLRAAKPVHSLWLCAEVQTAFDALAHVHALAADSRAPVAQHLADELIDGPRLSALVSSSDTLAALVPDASSRQRVSAVLSEMCA